TRTPCRVIFSCVRPAHLHCFPTRRSSDLETRAEGSAMSDEFRHVYRTELTPVSFLARSAYVFPQKTAVVHGARRYTYAQLAERRSEEHTSELQSRSDLVCRLLLEKKKNAK